jgi:hypothetical protein
LRRIRFSFFRGSGADTLGKNAEGVIEDYFPEDYFSEDYVELGSVTVRLFGDRRYVISYDVKMGKIHLEYGK